MADDTDNVMYKLAEFRDNLASLMDTQVLGKLAEFLTDTISEDVEALSKYKWMVENSVDGLDCKYAAVAKNFFLENCAENAAKTICWLYNNWAKMYDKE